MSTTTISPPAARRRALRHHILGGFVMEPPIAGAWASRIVGEEVDPISNFSTVCETILKKVRLHQVDFDLIGEVWPYEAKYTLITPSAKFSGYKGMDPCDMPKYKGGQDSKVLRRVLYQTGV